MKKVPVNEPTDDVATLLRSAPELLSEIFMNTAFGFGTLVTAIVTEGKPVIRATAIELKAESQAAFDATCDQVVDAVAAHSTYLSGVRHNA